jgi:hypothetical protein
VITSLPFVHKRCLAPSEVWSCPPMDYSGFNLEPLSGFVDSVSIWSKLCLVVWHVDPNQGLLCWIQSGIIRQCEHSIRWGAAWALWSTLLPGQVANSQLTSWAALVNMWSWLIRRPGLKLKILWSWAECPHHSTTDLHTHYLVKFDWKKLPLRKVDCGIVRMTW